MGSWGRPVVGEAVVLSRKVGGDSCHKPRKDTKKKHNMPIG